MLYRQRLALLLIGLVTGSHLTTAAPQAPPGADEVRAVGRRHVQEARREVAEGRARRYALGIFIQQLLPYLTSAFANCIVNIIVNWFYPLKVAPTIPGKVDFTRIWTSPLPWFG